MSTLRTFLDFIYEESFYNEYGEEFLEMFNELCKENNCGEFSPDRIRKKMKEERDYACRSKNLSCPDCDENTKLKYTPIGLFNHFKQSHPKLYEIRLGNKKMKEEDRIDYGIMLGKISLDRINATEDMIEKTKMWKYLLDNILGKEYFRLRSAHKKYVDLCEEKFGSIQNYKMELMESFSLDEVSQLYTLAEIDEDEYKEEQLRENYIEQIIQHFSEGINSVKHFSENATQTYGKIFIKHFPKYDSIANPSENVLSEFTTEELRHLVWNFGGNF